MINNEKPPQPKPPCQICHVMRRIAFLAVGLGIFVFFAYSPKYRGKAHITNLLGYLTLENVLYAMCVVIAAKLAFGAVKELLHK